MSVVAAEPELFDVVRPGILETDLRASSVCTSFSQLTATRIGCDVSWHEHPGKAWFDIEKGKVVRLEIKLALGPTRGDAEAPLAKVFEAVRHNFGTLVNLNGSPAPTEKDLFDKLDRDAERFRGSKLSVGSPMLQPARPPAGFAVSVTALRSSQGYYFAKLNMFPP